MSTLSISARPRALSGRHLGQLRRVGVVPAVVYGHGREPLSLEADARTLERLYSRAGRTTLIDLKVEGARSQKVLIREIQFNKRTGVVIHADFFAPDLTVTTVGDVPIVISGEAPAEALKIGLLLQVSNTIKVEALPSDLPSQLVVDASSLVDLDSQLTAGDVPLPAGVTLVTDPGDVIAKIGGRRTRTGGVSAEEDEEREEADAAAESAAAETAAEASSES